MAVMATATVAATTTAREAQEASCRRARGQGSGTSTREACEGASRCARTARAGTVCALASPSTSRQQAEPGRPLSRGSSGGLSGARSARRWLQRGQKPRQRYEHARGVRGRVQQRSDGQSERHARSGIMITAAPAGSAETALVRRRQRRRDRREEREGRAAERLEAQAAEDARKMRARERPEALKRPGRAPRALWHHYESGAAHADEPSSEGGGGGGGGELRRSETSGGGTTRPLTTSRHSRAHAPAREASERGTATSELARRGYREKRESERRRATQALAF